MHVPSRRVPIEGGVDPDLGVSITTVKHRCCHAENDCHTLSPSPLFQAIGNPQHLLNLNLESSDGCTAQAIYQRLAKDFGISDEAPVTGFIVDPEVGFEEPPIFSKQRAIIRYASVVQERKNCFSFLHIKHALTIVKDVAQTTRTQARRSSSARIQLPRGCREARLPGV